MITIGDFTSDDDVSARTIAMEKSLEGGEKKGEEADFLFTSDGFDFIRENEAEVDCLVSPGVTSGCRAALTGKFQRGRKVAKALFPVGELFSCGR